MYLQANVGTTSEDGSKKRRRRGAKGRESAKEIDRNRNENRTKDVTEKPEMVTTLSVGKKNKKKRKIPKKGEEGYLSPTQLRNARKRRAKKKDKSNGKIGNLAASTGSRKEGQNNTSNFLRKKCNDDDPSTKYLSNPLACPLVEKAKQYFSNLEVPFQTYLGALTDWRTVSKLPVRKMYENSTAKCTIGLFKPNSHKIMSVPDCSAHHPSINSIVKSLQQLCDELNIEPFEEKDGTGYLRYVCMNVDRTSKLVQLTLVWNSASYNENKLHNSGNLKKGKEQLDSLTQALISKKETFKLHSLWVHFNAQWKHADNIFDFGTATTCNKLWEHLHGSKHVIEVLDIKGLKGEVKLHFPPNVFRQANLDAFTKIVIAIREYIVQYNEKRAIKNSGCLPSCLELYGGVGTIGLHLHDLISNLLSSDENPFNRDCFMKSVRLMSAQSQGKISYVSKNATAVVENKDNNGTKGNKAEILVVDPPRKGLDEFVLKSLTGGNPGNGPCIFSETKLLIYVSCGFDAFQRDCDALLKSEKWTLDHAEGHVLFPGSNAIETLAFFKSK
jgi:23S rRNA (uracil1939-C5)-methyltransferase